MIRDITLGQYFPAGSIIHSLDARTKILGTLLFVIELFVVDSFFGFAVLATFLAAIIAASKVPVKFIFRGLTPVFAIILFTFVINLFMSPGRVLWHWWFLKIGRASCRERV